MDFFQLVFKISLCENYGYFNERNFKGCYKIRATELKNLVAQEVWSDRRENSIFSSVKNGGAWGNNEIFHIDPNHSNVPASPWGKRESDLS